MNQKYDVAVIGGGHKGVTRTSTLPDEGVFAVGGHNTAQVVITDIKGSWF